MKELLTKFITPNILIGGNIYKIMEKAEAKKIWENMKKQGFFAHSPFPPGRLDGSMTMLTEQEFLDMISRARFEQVEKPKRPKTPGRGSSQYY